MGVSELWSLLKAEGATVAWSGSNGGHSAIVQEVENTAIAIDLSTWIIQATLQPNLVEVFQDSECRALIVTFNRAVNFLRYGCVPVGVVEGRAPEEKLERLQQRFKARMGYQGGGSGNQQFARLGRKIAALLSALGVPVVQAPGEGEAMCAALNQHSLVDGCATLDGDVLLFGARTVYHTLKLQSQDPQNSEVLKVKLEGEQSVQSMLGIESGGADALTALSLLCGGDYAIKGAEHIGSKSAVRMLQHLLQGRQDDSNVLEDLADLVESPPDPSMEALSAQGCTGCKQCKHPGNRKNSIKKHTKANACPCCPRDFVEEHQTCQARPNHPCECPFHKQEALRHIDKAVRRIQATPGFVDSAQHAAAAYKKQRQAASQASELVRTRYKAAEGQSLTWLKRPDVQQMAEQLSWLEETQVRSKLLPLLMQWDLCHHKQAGCEFEPESIAKVHVQKAENEEACWRYILKWRRLPVGSPEEIEADREWLKKSGAEARAVKKSLMQEHYPNLVAEFLQKQKSGAPKQTQANKKKAAAKATKGMSSLMTSFLQQKKKLDDNQQQQSHGALLPEQPPRGLAEAPWAVGVSANSHRTAARAPGAAASAVNATAVLAPLASDDDIILHSHGRHRNTQSDRGQPTSGLPVGLRSGSASRSQSSEHRQHDDCYKLGHLQETNIAARADSCAMTLTHAPKSAKPHQQAHAPSHGESHGQPQKHRGSSVQLTETAAASRHTTPSARDDLGLDELLAFNSSQQMCLSSPAEAIQAAPSPQAVPGSRRVVVYDSREDSSEADEWRPTSAPTRTPTTTSVPTSMAPAAIAYAQMQEGAHGLHRQTMQDDEVIVTSHSMPMTNAADADVLLTPRQKRVAEEEELVNLASPDGSPASGVVLDLCTPSPAKRQRTPPVSPLHRHNPHQPIHTPASLSEIATPPADTHRLCPAGTSEEQPTSSDRQPQQQQPPVQLGRHAAVASRVGEMQSSKHQQQTQVEALGSPESCEGYAAKLAEVQSSQAMQESQRQATRQERGPGGRGGVKGRGVHSARAQTFAQAAAGVTPLHSARFGFTRLPPNRHLECAKPAETASSDPDISSDDDKPHAHTPRLQTGNTSVATPQTDRTAVWHELEVELLTPSDYLPQADSGKDPRSQNEQPAEHQPQDGSYSCINVESAPCGVQNDVETVCTPQQGTAVARHLHCMQSSPVNLLTPSSAASTVVTPCFSDCVDVVDLTQT